MESLGKIAIIGSGSWATALAKLILNNNSRINWYIRRADRIADFVKNHRNPVYLSDVTFDTHRIDFFSDINMAVAGAKTIVVAVPSPFFKDEAEKITVPMAEKNIVSAVKGIVPGDNQIVTDWFASRFGRRRPCHGTEDFDRGGRRQHRPAPPPLSGKGGLRGPDRNGKCCTPLTGPGLCCHSF